jgi:hypothetical protein
MEARVVARVGGELRGGGGTGRHLPSSRITTARGSPTPGRVSRPGITGVGLFELAHPAVQALDRLKAGAGSRRRCEALPKEIAAAPAETIARLPVVEGVVGQGGVKAVLERGTLPDEHHPGARPGTSRLEAGRHRQSGCLAAERERRGRPGPSSEPQPREGSRSCEGADHPRARSAETARAHPTDADPHGDGRIAGKKHRAGVRRLRGCQDADL